MPAASAYLHRKRLPREPFSVEMGELEHFLQTHPDIFVMHCYSVYISIQKYLKLHKNGVRFSEGEARRRHQPPWRSVSETSARKSKQRSHRPEPRAKAAFSLEGRCRRMRQRVGKENAPALQARISTDKKMAPSIAGRPFSYLWRWANLNISSKPLQTYL